ncbi:MAG: cobalamin-dependent protein [Desulfobulbaceae bacterium]|nr:cobalamin-dependent protein [Desulfobulbaceae bacterium]
MRVLLISPNTLTDPYPVYPLGLDYVAGSIAEEHEVRIADMQTVGLEALAELLKHFAPEIIGLSCRNIDNTDASAPLYFLTGYHELVAWLRERSPAVIVCGGCGFTIMPAQIFAFLGVDYGIIGEGERFGLLVEALKNNQNPAEVPGVLVAGGHTTPPPPWQGERSRRFPPEAGHHQFYVQQGGMLNLQSKRGCSFRCVYCPYPRIEGNAHRLTEPEEVAQTALQLQAAGAKYFFITDSAFNSDVEHSLAVASALRSAGVTIPWGAFFAPIKLPPKYFQVMATAGCRHVEFGTESLANSMLKTYRKPFQARDVFNAHRQARAAGLHVAHYFLLGGPGESAATVTESLNGIEQLDRTVCFFFIGIRIYPGTALYDMALVESKIDRQTDLLQPVFYVPDHINRETIATLVTQRGAGRSNWVVGSGGTDTATVVRTLHQRGFIGPLWEFLAR